MLIGRYIRICVTENILNKQKGYMVIIKPGTNKQFPVHKIFALKLF